MPKEEPQSQFVLMVHKDFADRTPAKVLRTTFEKVWKEKGWKEATKTQIEESGVSASTTSGT